MWSRSIVEDPTPQGRAPLSQFPRRNFQIEIRFRRCRHAHTPGLRRQRHRAQLVMPRRRVLPQRATHRLQVEQFAKAKTARRHDPRRRRRRPRLLHEQQALRHRLLILLSLLQKSRLVFVSVKHAGMHKHTHTELRENQHAILSVSAQERGHTPNNIPPPVKGSSHVCEYSNHTTPLRRVAAPVRARRGFSGKADQVLHSRATARFSGRQIPSWNLPPAVILRSFPNRTLKYRISGPDSVEGFGPILFSFSFSNLNSGSVHENQRNSVLQS